jgi:hypothetical protein
MEKKKEQRIKWHNKNKMLNCIDTHKKQQIQKKSFFFSFVHSLALGLRKITLMTVNNYGSIFVKIDRNVLMLNEFFALTSAYVLVLLI